MATKRTNYKKVYLKHFGYGDQDFVPCELCESGAAEVHHVNYRSLGGGNDIENLMALCRFHHDLAHAGGLKEDFLQDVHDQFLNQ